MKIVVISNIYPPFVRGGAELIAQQMVEGLVDHLQHVTVITTCPPKSLNSLSPERIRINGVPTWRFYPLNLYHYLKDYKFPFFMRFIWRLLDTVNVHSAFVMWRLLKRESPDVVITHNLVGIGMLTPLIINWLKLRHVHVIHDVQLYNPSGIIITGKEDSLLQKVSNAFQYARIMRFIFKSTDVVISPSRFLMNFYRSHDFFTYATRKIVPNPIALLPEEIIKTPSESLRLLYLGGVTEEKGVDGLLNAMQHVTEKSVQLKLIGTGPKLREYIIKAENDSRITFYGWQQRGLLRHFFMDTDVLIVPTRCYDNSPTVIYEALAHGIPVIASDSGGAKELIRPGENGWIFKTNDWKELASQISHAADHLSEVRAMSEECKKSVSDFTRDSYIGQVLDIISSEE